MRTDSVKKYVIPNIPYLFVLWACLKLGTAYRLAAGADLPHKLMGLGQTVGPAFADLAPGLDPFDWLIGIVGAVGFRLLIYNLDCWLHLRLSSLIKFQFWNAITVLLRLEYRIYSVRVVTSHRTTMRTPLPYRIFSVISLAFRGLGIYHPQGAFRIARLSIPT